MTVRKLQTKREPVRMTLHGNIKRMDAPKGSRCATDGKSPTVAPADVCITSSNLNPNAWHHICWESGTTQDRFGTLYKHALHTSLLTIVGAQPCCCAP